MNDALIEIVQMLDQITRRLDRLEAQESAGGTGTVHDAATLDAATHADDVLGLTGQMITLDSQAANAFLAGPPSGAAAAPTVRALVAADLSGVKAGGYTVTPGYTINQIVNPEAITLEQLARFVGKMADDFKAIVGILGA